MSLRAAPRVSDKALVMSVAYASRRIFPALSFYVKLHMHQLHALVSEQINRHGNNATPAPAGWLRPWAIRPAPPSLILPDSFSCLRCGILMLGQKHSIICSEGLISFSFSKVSF